MACWVALKQKGGVCSWLDGLSCTGQIRFLNCFPLALFPCFAPTSLIFIDAYCTVESHYILPTINNNFTISKTGNCKAELKKQQVNTRGAHCCKWDIFWSIPLSHMKASWNKSISSFLSCVGISYSNRKFGHNTQAYLFFWDVQCMFYSSNQSMEDYWIFNLTGSMNS